MPFTPVNDIDGTTHQLWTQDQDCGCGPSCIAMIANKLGKNPDEKWISSKISQFERKPSIANAAGQGHNFNTTGTFNVQEALRYINVPPVLNVYTDKTGNFDRTFKRCTKNRPGMAWLDWQQGQPG